MNAAPMPTIKCRWPAEVLDSEVFLMKYVVKRT